MRPAPIVLLLFLGAAPTAANWPQWRGGSTGCWRGEA